MASRAPSIDPGASLAGLHRLSLATYHRMVDAGILDEDDRVELLEGVLVDMVPHSPAHASVVERLNELFFPVASPTFRIRTQLPLTLADSEPEPDFALVSRSAPAETRHPTYAALVVEVAKTSAARDRGWKARVYAKAAIVEYWLIDVEQRAVVVHRQPDVPGQHYGSIVSFGEDDLVTPICLPELTLRVRDLFGSR